PDRYGERLETGRRWLLRNPRPQDWQSQMDGDESRSCLRLELDPARLFGSLRPGRQQGEVRERLRGGMDQGDERGSFRSRLILWNTHGVTRGPSCKMTGLFAFSWNAAVPKRERKFRPRPR